MGASIARSTARRMLVLIGTHAYRVFGLTQSWFRTWTGCFEPPTVCAIIAACAFAPRPCGAVPATATAGDASSPTAMAATMMERVSTAQPCHAEETINTDVRPGNGTVRPRAGARPLPSAHVETPRHADPRGRHRPRGRRGNAPGAGCGGRRHRLDRGTRRRRRPGDARRAPARRDGRRDPDLPGRHQGADHDAGGHGFPERQRGAA